MKRLIQFAIAAFVLACVLIFAVALGGGLMDSAAFTDGAMPPAH
ncbi:MAG: hypothetical protein ACOH1H_07870 [Brevundimonas sp.]